MPKADAIACQLQPVEHQIGVVADVAVAEAAVHAKDVIGEAGEQQQAISDKQRRSSHERRFLHHDMALVLPGLEKAAEYALAGWGGQDRFG